MSESLIEAIAPHVADSYDLLRAECGRFPTDDLVLVELAGEDREGMARRSSHEQPALYGFRSILCVLSL